jgi:flagellar hook assembly protein FlgD
MYKHYLTVDVDEQENAINKYNLFDCYPNPFNPSTNVRFSLALSGNVKIIIYNSLGEEIITLLNQSLLSGEHNVVWNGVDKNNNFVPSGVYFITMLAEPGFSGETNRFIKTIKSVLIK